MISAPEDYGLTCAQTLAFTYDQPAPPRFDDFWAQWRDAIRATPVRLRAEDMAGVSRITFQSIRDVTIAGLLSRPARRVRGAVVTTHGYDVSDEFLAEPDEWEQRDIAVLDLRVRGFPPSAPELGDLRGDWILHNIDDPTAWILSGAIADVVQGVRAIRQALHPSVPITLDGESFGGGLAVMTAAQLEQMNESIDRLIIAMPTFGAWRWRVERYCNGAGGQVNMLADALRGDDRLRLLEGIDLFDAVHHARRIRRPALAKLACRDDVVPAPSAAAVFNALGSVCKWAFTTRYGHFDGGIADARLHARFDRLRLEFADPDVDPAEMLRKFRLNVDNTAGIVPNRL